MLSRRALAAGLMLAATVGCGDDPGATPSDDASVDQGSADIGAPPEPGDDAGGDAEPSADADGGPPPLSPYTIAVLPDTQFYSSSWPEIFNAQTKWVAENRGSQQIAFAVQLGDLVDADLSPQWAVADRAMANLDGNVPYVIAAGNHDYTNLADRVGMANQFFPVTRFSGRASFGGTFEPNHIENSYSLLPAGGVRWLVIALEFAPRDEAVAWANGVLKQFPGTPAIIITHAYLYWDGNRYNQHGPFQSYSPHSYFPMDRPGSSINDGEELWQKLVEPNSNVKFVLSGHMVGDGASLGFAANRLTSTRADGSTVHQLLSNYQYCLGGPCGEVHGGNGYLRLMRFSPADGSVDVQTYSPYLDQYLTDPQNQFALRLD